MNFGTPFPLGKIFGVMVRLDASLLLLIALFVVQSLGGGVAGIVNALTFAVLLIFSIYLHEMGHAIAASWFNIRTLDVTLMFFGGYARLLGVPKTPFQQIVVSFAGPAVNLLIAAALYFYMANSGHVTELLWQLTATNLFLGAFNLLPGFPLDGGRITAAIISNFMPARQARVIAGYIGVGLGLLLIGASLKTMFGSPVEVQLGLFAFTIGGPFTILLAFLLIVAASQEIQMNQDGRF